MLLAASILSKQDHGYSLDLGISGTTAFLPFSSATSADLPPFHVILVCVASIEASLVKVSMDYSHALVFIFISCY